MQHQPPPSIYSLPLFPLNYVLFPQFPLQLHIFEERYRSMISGCIERDDPFGVVLIAEGEETGTPAVPHTVGCLARILAVKTLDDGRMNLLAVGERRFKLLEYSQAELPYLVGRVESLEDDQWAEDEPERPLRELHRLFRKYLALLAECSGVALPKLALPDDPTALGFCVAAVTQLSALEKQRLLAMTDPEARLKAEKRLLRRQIKELETLKTCTNEGTPGQTPPAQTLSAERLDLTTEFWKGYVQNSRN